ncbi:uncharacterized protein Bfra_011888 [Botrytis fragariae]|uniref:Uncharacterized protein n=1 Tax=Botrytis fragariae TaxID=1964551 RepID=A0A8H6EEA1_9HELO|nr:uncharacterized protein Bfra_011888 [Botrytis fragariae]KAF5868923.1 hypothetical protein Bfra_011888 [Botrytis fragariae]
MKVRTVYSSIRFFQPTLYFLPFLYNRNYFFQKLYRINEFLIKSQDIHQHNIRPVAQLKSNTYIANHHTSWPR